MTLMDEKFGAELVTKKGKIYKFDDMNCLLNYYHSGLVPSDDFLHKLVVDFSNPSTLIDATQAHYVSSPGIRSPMDSQIAAFASQSTLEEFNKRWNGTHLSWAEVTSNYK
jgi:copper chaperone NosL